MEQTGTVTIYRKLDVAMPILDKASQDKILAAFREWQSRHGKVVVRERLVRFFFAKRGGFNSRPVVSEAVIRNTERRKREAEEMGWQVPSDEVAGYGKVPSDYSAAAESIRLWVNNSLRKMVEATLTKTQVAAFLEAARGVGYVGETA